MCCQSGGKEIIDAMSGDDFRQASSVPSLGGQTSLAATTLALFLRLVLQKLIYVGLDWWYRSERAGLGQCISVQTNINNRKWHYVVVLYKDVTTNHTKLSCTVLNHTELHKDQICRGAGVKDFKKILLKKHATNKQIYSSLYWCCARLRNHFEVNARRLPLHSAL